MNVESTLSPSEDEEGTYGKDIGEILETTYISRHEGNGCVFSLPLDPSMGVFTDCPLYSYIHHFSRTCAMICENCHRPVGSVIDNINHLLHLHRTSLSKEIVTLIQSKEYDNGPSTFIRCYNCSKTYCSHRCMEDSKVVHTFFCQQMTPEELRLWSSFQRYCLKTDENFYFVGLIYTKLVAEVLSKGRKLEDIILELSGFYEISRDDDSLKEEGLDPSDGDQLESASKAFTRLMNTLKRFEQAIKEQDLHHARRVFSQDYFLLLLDKIKLVAVEIEIENPLNKQLRLLMQDSTIRSAIGKQLRSIKSNLYGLDYTDMELEEWELDLPDILGLGIYKSLSKLNHSCSPTLEVEYSDSNVAKITLLRPVSKGEQATIAYIDVTTSFTTRRKELMENYNFTCHCQKCVDDEEGGKITTKTESQTQNND